MISFDSYADEMTKIAKLRVGDVEDRLGFYLSDMNEHKARKLIAERKNKSFALRHPWLTGLPTLGLAPAIAKERAVSRITNRMLRDDRKLRKQLGMTQEREHRRSVEKAKAEQPERAARELGRTATSMMAMHQLGKK